MKIPGGKIICPFRSLEINHVSAHPGSPPVTYKLWLIKALSTNSADKWPETHQLFFVVKKKEDCYVKFIQRRRAERRSHRNNVDNSGCARRARRARRRRRINWQRPRPDPGSRLRWVLIWHQDAACQPTLDLTLSRQLRRGWNLCQDGIPIDKCFVV